MTIDPSQPYACLNVPVSSRDLKMIFDFTLETSIMYVFVFFYDINMVEYIRERLVRARLELDGCSFECRRRFCAGDERKDDMGWIWGLYFVR